MYIYTKLKYKQTQTYPKLPTPHPSVRNTAAHPHIHKKIAKWAYHIHYLLLQMKRIRLMYATVRGGTVCTGESNIKQGMKCQ